MTKYPSYTHTHTHTHKPNCLSLPFSSYRRNVKTIHLLSRPTFKTETITEKSSLSFDILQKITPSFLSRSTDFEPRSLSISTNKVCSAFFVLYLYDNYDLFPFLFLFFSYSIVCFFMIILDDLLRSRQ